MKVVHIIILIVGIILTFATESESATANIIGLLMVVYECEKLNLLSNESEKKKARKALFRGFLGDFTKSESKSIEAKPEAVRRH